MALSIQEYYQILVAEVQGQEILAAELSGELPVEDVGSMPEAITRTRTLLGELNSRSKVAIWRLQCLVMACIMWMQATLWDKAKAELQAIADTGNTDRDEAFLEDVALFEYPSTLIVDPTSKKVVFSPSNAANRIITNKAIKTDNLGVSNILVAKSVDGVLVKLTVNEMDALRAYGKIIQPVGTNVQYFSRDGDVLKLKLHVYFDPLGGYTDTQFLALADVVARKALQTTDFRGAFNIIKFEDTFQALPAYKNLWIENIQAKQNGASLWANFVQNEYHSVAGYLIPSEPDWEILVHPYNQ